MSSNLKLVKYFVQKVFTNNSHDADRLSNLVSPQFTYHLNLGFSRNYSQFVKKMQAFTAVSTVIFGKIATEDNIHFYGDFEVRLPEPNHNLKTYGFSQLVIRNGLIHQIDINYHADQDEYEEFRSLIKSSKTVLL